MQTNTADHPGCLEDIGEDRPEAGRTKAEDTVQTGIKQASQLYYMYYFIVIFFYVTIHIYIVFLKLLLQIFHFTCHFFVFAQ